MPRVSIEHKEERRAQIVDAARTLWPPSDSIRRVGRDYVLSILFWLTTSLLVTWQQHELILVENLHLSLRDVMVFETARYLSIALLTPPIFYVARYWPVTNTRSWGRAAAYLLAYIPFSIAFAIIRWCLYPPWLVETQTWGARTLASLVSLVYETFADILLVYLGITVAAHAYFYFSLSQRHEIERLELRRALAQSELEALKLQLHPHFLFNTLHGISALIDTDRVTAKSMVVKLGALLRAALKHRSGDLVPLREELDFLTSYLELEQMRLGRRLQVQWRIPPRARGALIPQLILQPLIENAIVHGIACCREGGWINIESTCAEAKLHIMIRNSVGGQSTRGLGLGIANVKSRLQYLYQDEATFEFLVNPPGLATATLVLPAFAEVSRGPEEVNAPLAGVE